MAQRTPPPRKATGTSKAGRKPGKSIVNQRQTPWGLIATVAAVVVFAAVIVIVVVAKSGNKSSPTAASGPQVIPTTPTGTVTVQQTPKQVTNTTGISGVLAWDTQGWPGNQKSYPGALQHDHVTGPVTYAVTPPVGGPHNVVWMNAGVYTAPVPSERAVHNLEHGAVWITYDPHLPAAQLRTLTAFVTKQSIIAESQQASGIAGQANRYIDLTPWATNTLPTPIVLSAWGYQLRVTSPTDPRMQQFIDKFRDSATYAPEHGSAVDGQPVSTSGRPALDGSTKPNPA